MPIERLNSILVITPRAAYLEEARRWIAKLDQPGSGGSQAQLNIYRVQNGNARHLAGVLSGIFGGSTDRKSTRLNSSHLVISYAVFCLKKKSYRHCSCRPRR